jgi:hypothetical protein
MRADKNKATEIRRILGVTSALILMLVLISLIPKQTKAAASIQVKEINYQNSTITLQLNEGDTSVYFSDSMKRTWEEIPGTIQSNKTVTMDISWISVSTNYVMNFKGNSSTAIVSVTIPKQATNFRATFNKIKGTISFKNSGNRNVEWRKKGSTTWKTVDINTIASELSQLYSNGATVYFRLAFVNGSSTSNVGFRPSKEVTITVPKKPSAPEVTINGSQFSIEVKKGMAYRTMNKDGSATDWTTVGSSTDLLLKNIAPSVLYNTTSVTSSAITMQFRTNAKSTALMSKTGSVTIPIQEGPPSLEAYGISLNYTSSSSLSLQVKAANSKTPFEYTVVKEGSELNYQTTGWTAITSSTAITLDNSAAKAGSRIYVRKKSVGSLANSDFALASAEVNVTGAIGITYPEAPAPTTLTTLITTAGVCKASKTSSHLTFSLYSATSTTVSSINFMDTYGISKGSVTSKSTVAKNPNSNSISDKYIITTTITSTESIDNITEELLFAKLTLANSDVITSSSNAGILLYLYPKTKVNNPTEKDYATSFKRVYLSNSTEDTASFKFRLDFGTVNVIDTTAVGKYTSTPTAISSIKFDDYTLNQGSDYTVVYSTYVNDDNVTIATATVNVNVASFEGSSLIDITDKAAPLEIYLNNNEVLDEDINITLSNTATLKDIPIAWSITEGSLKETKTQVVTNPDNTTTTVTEEVITYILELNIFNSSYSVSIADVTWGGSSIFGSAKISGGKATIYLSNTKINKLTTNSTTTNNVVITLSNGFTIRTGCKLTILNAS